MKNIKIGILIAIIINILNINHIFSSSVEATLTIPQIVEKYGKAVVLIATAKKDSGTIGLGSGFIVDPNGIILTNYHIIEGAYPALIKSINGDIYDDIYIIETDKKRDIAVLKIKGWNLPFVQLGNSDSIKVGERIVAIGNPEGLENTVTDGLISGIRDTGEGYKLHQISAPISAGSSGSPVFNMKGEVIGVATSSIIEGQNLNFSVPINYAKGLIRNEVQMSLREFSEKINRIHFPPPSGAIFIIPEKIRNALFEGARSRIERSDINFIIFNHIYLPARENIHNVFLFKILSKETVAHAFLQFFKLKNFIPTDLIAEVYIPVKVSPTFPEDFFTTAYPLPPGDYLLSMALTNKNLEKVGTHYFPFSLPYVDTISLDTTPIFFIKKIERIDRPETKTEVHKNFFTYSILRLWPKTTYTFQQGDNLDVFYSILGSQPDYTGKYSIDVKYEVFKGEEKVISYAKTSYDSPIVSQMLPLKKTVIHTTTGVWKTTKREKQTDLESGSYTLTMNIKDNVSKNTIEKRISFEIR